MSGACAVVDEVRAAVWRDPYLAGTWSTLTGQRVAICSEQFFERGTGWAAVMDASSRGAGHGWCPANCMRGLSLSAVRQRGADCGGSSDLAEAFGVVGGPGAVGLPAPVDDLRTETRAVGW